LLKPLHRTLSQVLSFLTYYFSFLSMVSSSLSHRDSGWEVRKVIAAPLLERTGEGAQAASSCFHYPFGWLEESTILAFCRPLQPKGISFSLRLECLRQRPVEA
jgi:hypothetical protein